MGFIKDKEIAAPFGLAMTTLKLISKEVFEK
jgi:hypothetical protein